MDGTLTARRAWALISLRKAPPAKAGLNIALRDRTTTEPHRASERQVIHRARRLGVQSRSLLRNPEGGVAHATPHRPRQARRPPTARRAISAPPPTSRRKRHHALPTGADLTVLIATTTAPPAPRFSCLPPPRPLVARPAVATPISHLDFVALQVIGLLPQHLAGCRPRMPLPPGSTG